MPQLTMHAYLAHASTAMTRSCQLPAFRQIKVCQQGCRQMRLAGVMRCQLRLMHVRAAAGLAAAAGCRLLSRLPAELRQQHCSVEQSCEQPHALRAEAPTQQATTCSSQPAAKRSLPARPHRPKLPCCTIRHKSKPSRFSPLVCSPCTRSRAPRPPGYAAWKR